MQKRLPPRPQAPTEPAPSSQHNEPAKASHEAPRLVELADGVYERKQLDPNSVEYSIAVSLDSAQLDVSPRRIAAAPDVTIVDSVEWLDEAFLQDETSGVHDPSTLQQTGPVTVEQPLRFEAAAPAGHTADYDDAGLMDEDDMLTTEYEDSRWAHPKYPHEPVEAPAVQQRRAAIMDERTSIHPHPSAAAERPIAGAPDLRQGLERVLADAKANERFGLDNNAETLLKHAVALSPNNIEAHEQLKGLYLRSGRIEEAGQQLLLLADLYMEHDLGRAKRYATRAVELMPRHPGAHRRLAELARPW